MLNVSAQLTHLNTHFFQRSITHRTPPLQFACLSTFRSSQLLTISSCCGCASTTTKVLWLWWPDYPAFLRVREISAFMASVLATIIYTRSWGIDRSWLAPCPSWLATWKDGTTIACGLCGKQEENRHFLPENIKPRRTQEFEECG